MYACVPGSPARSRKVRRLRPDARRFLAAAQDFVAAAQLERNGLRRRRVDPGGDEERFAGRYGRRRIDAGNGEIVGGGALQGTVIDGDIARGRASGEDGGIAAGPAAIRQYQHLARRIARYERQRRLQAVGQVGSIVADLVNKAGKLSRCRRLLDGDGAAKRDDGQAIVRPHRLVQKVEDFLLCRRAAGRHGLAAVGNDDESARLAGQPQHYAA